MSQSHDVSHKCYSKQLNFKKQNSNIKNYTIRLRKHHGKLKGSILLLLIIILAIGCPQYIIIRYVKNALRPL